MEKLFIETRNVALLSKLVRQKVRSVLTFNDLFNLVIDYSLINQLLMGPINQFYF